MNMFPVLEFLTNAYQHLSQNLFLSHFLHTRNNTMNAFYASFIPCKKCFQLNMENEYFLSHNMSLISLIVHMAFHVTHEFTQGKDVIFYKRFFLLTHVSVFVFCFSIQYLSLAYHIFVCEAIVKP